MNSKWDGLREPLERIKSRIDADKNSLLMGTVNLRSSDYELLGKLIQLYCYADLNARRLIDLLRHAAIGPEARYAGRLQDAQVFPKLYEAASLLWDSELKDGLLKACGTIEMHRVHRHNFAHWAARRIRNEDVLILFTKNAREAERRDGAPQTPDELKYALVPLAGFPEELEKLEGHANYLAYSAAHLETHFNGFRQKFSE